MDGEVGGGNPMLANGDAIRDRGASDEITLSTLRPGASKWLRLDLTHRVAASFSRKMTHVVGEPAPVGAPKR